MWLPSPARSASLASCFSHKSETGHRTHKTTVVSSLGCSLDYSCVLTVFGNSYSKSITLKHPVPGNIQPPLSRHRAQSLRCSCYVPPPKKRAGGCLVGLDESEDVRAFQAHLPYRLPPPALSQPNDCYTNRARKSGLLLCANYLCCFHLASMSHFGAKMPGSLLLYNLFPGQVGFTKMAIRGGL